MYRWMGLGLLSFGISSGAYATPSGSTESISEAPIFPLESDLGPITEDSLFDSSEVSLQVVNVSTGEEVYLWGEDTPLIPASVMKVLTTAVALKTLGGSYRYQTGFYRDSDINAEGVLQGDLYVHGNGDPTMVLEDMWKMVYDLGLAGVREIEGDLVFDDSYFDDRHLIEGWRKDVDMEQGPAYFAPTGALSLNFNTVCIVVSPGGSVGEAGGVRLEVPFDDVSFDNQLRTVSASSRGWVSIERTVNEDEGTVEYSVQGRVPVGTAPERHYRAVYDPLAFYMSTLNDLLEMQGVELGGVPREGLLPEDAEIVIEHRSISLSEILSHTNKYSNNFMAEQVLKTVGAEVLGVQGSTEAGLRVMTDYLESLGIPAEEFTLVNGSGLARGISIRPSHINAVLVDMFHDPRNAPEFMASLSIAGVDGTLRRRYTEDELVGRVRGKTGSLNGVACLTGYFRADDGEIYALTILANGLRRSRPMRALHDRLGEALLAVDAVPLSMDSESASNSASP